MVLSGSTRDRQYRYWQMANAILSCLRDNGSPIQMLVFNPDHPPSKFAAKSEKDSSGHTWPLYAYEKGNCGLDSDSTVGPIVSVALKFEDMHLVEPYHIHVRQVWRECGGEGRRR